MWMLYVCIDRVGNLVTHPAGDSQLPEIVGLDGAGEALQLHSLDSGADKLEPFLLEIVVGSFVVDAEQTVANSALGKFFNALDTAGTGEPLAIIVQDNVNNVTNVITPGGNHRKASSANIQ